MSVYYDIYVLSIHNAKVCFCFDRLRSSEQYVRELCSTHGTAPSIGKSVTKSLTNQCFRFGCITHMRHMHCAGNFTVNCSWFDSCFVPQILCMLRCSLQPSGYASDLSVFFLSQVRHFMSKIIDIFAFCLNAPFFCDTDQFFRIFYLIVASLFCMSEGDTNFTSVIRMCSSSTSCKTKEVSSYDTMCITSTDSSWCLWCNTARTHGTDTTTDTLLAELTVWSLIFYSKLPGICANLCACL